MGQRNRRMEDHNPGPGLARNQHVAKREDLNQKLKSFQKCLGRRGKQNYRGEGVDGGLGVEPPTFKERSLQPLDDYFFVIFRKKAYFNAIWITFSTFLEPFQTIRFLRFKSQLKKLNCSVLSLLIV